MHPWKVAEDGPKYSSTRYSPERTRWSSLPMVSAWFRLSCYSPLGSKLADGRSLLLFSLFVYHVLLRGAYQQLSFLASFIKVFHTLLEIECYYFVYRNEKSHLHIHIWYLLNFGLKGILQQNTFLHDSSYSNLWMKLTFWTEKFYKRKAFKHGSHFAFKKISLWPVFILQWQQLISNSSLLGVLKTKFVLLCLVTWFYFLNHLFSLP